MAMLSMVMVSMLSCWAQPIHHLTQHAQLFIQLLKAVNQRVLQLLSIARLSCYQLLMLSLGELLTSLLASSSSSSPVFELVMTSQRLGRLKIPLTIFTPVHRKTSLGFTYDTSMLSMLKSGLAP